MGSRAAFLFLLFGYCGAVICATTVTAGSCGPPVILQSPKEARKQLVLRTLISAIEAGGDCPTAGALGSQFKVEGETVTRWAEAALTPDQITHWNAHAKKKKVLTYQKMPAKREAVVRQVRAIVVMPEEDRPRLTMSTLAATHGVEETALRRWLNADLTQDEMALWQKNLKRRPPRIDPEFAARKKTEVLAKARAALAKPFDVNDYTTHQDIADECEVSARTVSSWLETLLSEEERKEWESRRHKFRWAISAKVRAERRTEAVLVLGVEVEKQISLRRTDPKYVLSTNAELAEKYEVTPRHISLRLSEALNPDDIAYRAHILAQQGQTKSIAELSAETLRRRELICAQVQKEHAEIEAGEREHYSSNEELAELFESSTAVVARATKYLSAPLLRTRAHRQWAKGKDKRYLPYREQKRRIQERIRAEIDEVVAGRSQKISNNQELADELGVVSPWVISVLASDILTDDEMALRSRLGKRISRTEYRNTEEEVIARVREEIEAIRNDPQALFTTSSELGIEFGLMNQTVNRWLRLAFTPEDLELRRERIDLERNRRRHETVRNGVGATVWNGLAYDSMMEAASSELLQKYAGLTAEEGSTVHVRVGRLEYDFKVGDTLVEFHPIVLVYPHGDFRSADEYGEYVSELETLEGEEKAAFREMTKAWLLERYADARAANHAIDEQELRLEVVASVEELHNFIQIETGSPTLPEVKPFRSEFNRILRQLKETKTQQTP